MTWLSKGYSFLLFTKGPAKLQLPVLKKKESPRGVSTLQVTWKVTWQNLSLLISVVADGIKSVHVSETLFFKSLLWCFFPQTSLNVDSVCIKYK